MEDEKKSEATRAAAAAEEEAVEEVMKWLENETSSDGGECCQAAASPFVTINGNEESCGPSFSGAASTVMASLDTRAAPPAHVASRFVGGPADQDAWPGPPPVAWPWTGGGVSEEKKSLYPEPPAAAEEWVALLLGGATFETDENLL